MTFVQEATRENKLRLLMIYASIYPEKFEGDKGVKLMQVAIYLFVIYSVCFLNEVHELNVESDGNFYQYL